jgi:glycosyltransferase involved in cell wall biosynthesis
MRVLMLSYEYPPLGGGGARVVAGLSAELVRLGHAVDLVSMGFPGLPRREETGGVRVHRVPCLRRRLHTCSAAEAASYAAAALGTAGRLAARREHDVVHAHFIFPDGLVARVASALARRPYVVTAHGSDVPGYNPDRLHVLHALLAPVWNRVVGGAAEIVCPSRSLQALLTKRAPQARVSLIPNGFDPGTLAVAARRRPDRILVVARLLRRKGVRVVLEALHGLPDGSELVVVGDGPEAPALRRLAERLGVNARFTGWLDNASPELRELYETSSVFALPSEAENFPVVLLEAMAAGLAIVTTRGTGCAEVVGDTALLVPPRDAGALRAALRLLLADPARRGELGRAARARLEAHYAWPSVAKRYVELYERHVGTWAAEARGGRGIA